MHGISFPVDEISTVDNSNVKLVVGGKAVIIPRSELETRVVKTLLESKESAARFSLSSLSKFALESIKNKNAAWAGYALAAVLQRSHEPEKSRQAAEEILLGEGSKDEDLTVEVAKHALDQIGSVEAPRSSDGTEIAVLVVGLREPSWIREHALRVALDRKSSVRLYFREEILRAFRARDFDRAKRIVNLYSDLYGEGDRDFDRLSVLIARVATALKSAEMGDVDPLYTLFEVSKTEPEVGELLSPILIEAIHREANRAFTSGDSARVLEILARIDFSKRTPTTHDLVVRALGALLPSEAVPLGDPVVKEFLVVLSQQDERVHQAYLEFVDREANYLFAAGKVDEVSNAIDHALAIRPDPSPENDQYRFRQALELLDRQMPISARIRIGEIQTGLTTLQRAKLFVVGYYGNPWFFVLLALIPIIYLVYLVVKTNRIREERRAQFGSRPPPQDPTEPQFSDEEPPPSFVSSRARTLSPAMKEYRNLLAVLGLKSGADVRSIKATYRQLIKEVHPDLNKDLNEADKERFVSLTRAYERVLELRKEMGMPE